MDARASVRESRTMLIHVKAVDVISNFEAPAPVGKELPRSLLRVPSLTKTKRLPASCLVHIGMEMRLTTTLAMSWAIQDATATVSQIQCVERSYNLANASRNAEVFLDQLPVAVLI